MTLPAAPAPEFCPQVHPNWVKLSGAVRLRVLEGVRAHVAKLPPEEAAQHLDALHPWEVA